MREQNADLLLSRAKAVVWIVLAGIVTFSAAKAWFEPSTGLSWYVPALVLGVTQFVMMALLQGHPTPRQTERILLLDATAACAIIAWLGIASGRSTGSDFFLLGVAINTAAVVPWAPKRQAVLGFVAAAAIIANGYGIHGSLLHSVDFRTFVPVVVLIGASFYTSYSMEAARLTSARDQLLRERAEAETSELNSLLERRVVERTKELQAANDELEAFAYSVSHDLRAPLRAMDGLSEALVEDYADALDGTAKDYLGRIRSEASRLGHLVDDLLGLSRVTRALMKRQEVDLSGIARTIAEQLQLAHPQRVVEFAIDPDLRAECDGPLVRALLENLLGNAFKFTQRNPAARIEFGRAAHDGKSAFFLSDNGVGFDMAHAGKIFGAFERLHGSEEFEGTGIGLTTVDRIVRRHGGTIVANAEPGKGATFYFTLSPAEKTIL